MVLACLAKQVHPVKSIQCFLNLDPHLIFRLHIGVLPLVPLLAALVLHLEATGGGGGGGLPLRSPSLSVILLRLHPRDGGDGLPGLGGGVGDGVGAPLLVPLVHAVELQLELLVRYLEKWKIFQFFDKLKRGGEGWKVKGCLIIAEYRVIVRQLQNASHSQFIYYIQTFITPDIALSLTSHAKLH